MDSEFHFDFDPCPLHGTGGLEIEWGNVNYVNPPYSRKLKENFVKRAVEVAEGGKICVMLLPVSTSTRLFHDYILPYASEIRFVDGRVAFAGINSFGDFVDNKKGMHDSMIVIFGTKSMPKRIILNRLNIA